ncbi:hypothetical protein ACIGFK_18410 [Streptomyces sp. NPDC085524]|uniref:hypothetical protein n=1 Tax=Streptomyces sp. NPDC085524 TaxID=3365728 RepID=UPI0037D732A5
MGELVDGFGEVGQAELAGRGADAVAGQLAQGDFFVARWVVNGRSNPQEPERRSAIHGSLDRFDPVDVAFDNS